MMHGPNLAPRTDFGSQNWSPPCQSPTDRDARASMIYLPIITLLAISSMLSMPAVETPTLTLPEMYMYLVDIGNCVTT